ncbi:hypothetical protein GVN22_26900 [Cellulophaga sp. BC115SP]|nr:hypothetical protein [Cellulophaga sp. BC115SP]
MLAYPSSMLFGQSTSTLPAPPKETNEVLFPDSSAVVKLFYDNAPAILDSLTRFTFVKANNKVLSLEVNRWKLDYYRATQDAQTCVLDKLTLSKTTTDISIKLNDTKARLKNSKTENWCWRIAAAVGIYFALK